MDLKPTHHEPSVINKSTLPTPRHKAVMSISALLNPSDEPASNEPKASKMKLLSTKRPFIDQQHSELSQTENNSSCANQNTSCSIFRRPPIQSQQPAKTNEVDLRGSMDMTFNGAAGNSFDKKSNSSFKYFKYHDSMKLAEDAHKSYKDVDDGKYQVEKQAYVANRLEGTAENATSDREKQKRRRWLLQTNVHENHDGLGKPTRKAAKTAFYDDAMTEAMKKENQEKRKRKTDMQRERRREKAAIERKAKAEAKAKLAAEVREKEKVERAESVDAGKKFAAEPALRMGIEDIDSDHSLVVVAEAVPKIGRRKTTSAKNVRQPKEGKQIAKESKSNDMDVTERNQ